MLYFYKQIQKTFSNTFGISFTQGGSEKKDTHLEEDTLSKIKKGEIDKLDSTIRQDIKNFIDSLDKDNDGKVDSDVKDKENQERKKQLKELIKFANRIEKLNTRSITKIELNHLRDVLGLEQQTISKLHTFNDNIRTEEVISTIDGETIDREVLQKKTNLRSLQKILKRKEGISVVVADLREAAKADGQNLDNFRYRASGILGNNYGNIKDVLENTYGYKHEGWGMGNEETALVVSTIRDYNETQESIQNLSKEEQFRLLVDFNKNGYINTDPKFYIGEAQTLYQTLHALSSDGINAVMVNLGLGTIKDFSEKMSINLFLARETFQRKLGVLFEMGVKPAEITTAGGVKKALNKKAEKQEELANEIAENIESYIDAKYSYLNMTQEEKRALKLEGVGVVLGSTQGIGASVNIEKLTKGFVDSLQVGLVDGKPGIAFSKKLYEGNGLSVGASLSNFVVPIIGVNYKIKESDPKIQTLLQNKIKGSYEPSIYIASSPTTTAIGASVERVSEKTQKGIEKMKQNMAQVLIKTKSDLLNNKSFDESETKQVLDSAKDEKEQGGIDIQNQRIYTEMQQAYTMYIKGKANESLLLDNLMSAYLGYYENQLYQNAEGRKLTSLSVGFALMGGFLPIPFFAIGGERISTKYKQVKDVESQARERGISRKELSQEQMKQLGIEKVYYKGKDCIKIKDNGYILSSSYKSTFADKENGNFYIPLIQNGEQIRFTIDESVVAQGVRKAIVLGDGLKDKDGEYISTHYDAIEKSSNDRLNEKYLASTLIIREKITHIFNGDLLKKNSSFKRLQKIIFSSLEKGKVEKNVWNSFVRTVNSEKIEGYIENDTKAIKSLSPLREQVKFNFNEEEKLIILQTVLASFMKKEKFTYEENGGVKLKKSIKEYDEEHGRSTYFDNLFQEKYGKDTKLLNSIKKARNTWYQGNGKSKSYTMQSVSDSSSIAFVGSQVGDSAELTPHMGAYNLAKTESGESLIELSSNKSDAVIDSLPDSFLDSLKKKINAGLPNREKLKSRNDVKDFMKSGGFEYELYFGKIGECLNDALIMKNIKIKGDIKIETTATGAVYDQENDVKKFAIGYVGPKVKKEDKPESTPGEEEIPGEDKPESTPGEEEIGDTEEGGLGGDGQQGDSSVNDGFDPAVDNSTTTTSGNDGGNNVGGGLNPQ